MYYNIKIKSNGSEFSLESSNKEITQREMDIYFAQIFNASETFKSQIKKVEINNTNLKSITELETNSKNNTQFKPQTNQLQQNNTPSEIPTQAIKPTNTPEVKNIALNIIPENKPEIKIVSISPQVANKFETEENLAQVNLQNYAQPIIQNISLPSQVQIKEELPPLSQTIIEVSKPSLNEFKNQTETQETLENTPTILSQESTPQPLIQENTPEFTFISEKAIEFITEEPTQEITYTYTAETFNQDNEEYSEAPIPQSEIDELIAIAQNKLNALNINAGIPTHQPYATTTEAVDLAYDTIDLDLSKSKFASRQDFSQSLAQEKERYNSGTQEPKNNYYDYGREEQINNIFNEKKEENIEEENTPTIETITLETPVVELTATNLSEIQTQPTQTQVQTSYTTDFKLYLDDFKCENQTDKFLVCAYYIKNILKEQNFSMKSINSKLFQATGMIANLDVLDDLISKEYIRVIDTEDSKKYCITPDGESYFINRFQG